MPFVLREYHKARTHFDPRRPSARLVTTGPYRYSRNPAYLALTLLYLGGSAAVDSLWVLAGAAPAVLAAHWGVILPEERYLEGKFGDAYRGYKRTVRRWL
jgi:protein-S-isoprenylcysteine O-methyltransferase Ste14